eukprot:scaffold41446_cov73-Attheya_sp.AAC.2
MVPSRLPDQQDISGSGLVMMGLLARWQTCRSHVKICQWICHLMICTRLRLDNDGVLDCRDECPKIIDKAVPGLCGCGIVDTDSGSDEPLSLRYNSIF